MEEQEIRNGSEEGINKGWYEATTTCVCVWERARERDIKKLSDRKRQTKSLSAAFFVCIILIPQDYKNSSRWESKHMHRKYWLQGTVLSTLLLPLPPPKKNKTKNPNPLFPLKPTKSTCQHTHKNSHSIPLPSPSPPPPPNSIPLSPHPLSNPNNLITTSTRNTITTTTNKQLFPLHPSPPPPPNSQTTDLLQTTSRDLTQNKQL